MRKIAFTSGVAGMLLLASGAVKAEDEGTIVVKGYGTPEQIENTSQGMARAMTTATVGDQVARWDDPVCLRVEGVSEANGRIVRSTVEAVARDAKVRVGKAKCDPNVFVIFSRDARVLAQRLADRLPPARDRKVAAARAAFTQGESGPLRWETRVSLRDTRRGPMAANSAALMNSGDYKLNIDVPVTDSFEPSMIRKPTKASIDGMIVLVDAAKAEGMELGQVGEYVAMVVLARPPMNASFAEHPSILNLAGYAPPGPSSLRISAWDRAYLKALYSAPVDRSAAATRSIIADRMAKELGG